MSRLLREIPAELPLAVVIDASSGDWDNSEPERGNLGLAARSLDELTGSLDLKAFVVMSALAGAIEQPGCGVTSRAEYAALEALVRRRHAQGLPAILLALGPWEDDSPHLRPFRRLTIDATLTLLPWTQRYEPVLVVADIDWDALQGLADMEEVESKDFLTRLICAQAAAVLGGPANSIGVADNFLDLGFSSLTALDLCNKLYEITGEKVDATAVYENHTATALSDCLYRHLSGA